jgi:hypothetical protein
MCTRCSELHSQEFNESQIDNKRRKIMKIISYCLFILVLFAIFGAYVIAAEPSKMSTSQIDNQSLQGPQRSSQIVGMSVKNPEGQNLGKIDELVIGQDGTINYVILSHGGLLGIGDKVIPIPWKALKQGDNKNYLTVNITQDTLKKAPNFDPKEWPNFTEPEWQKKVQVYYEIPSGQTAGR